MMEISIEECLTKISGLVQNLRVPVTANVLDFLLKEATKARSSAKWWRDLSSYDWRTNNA